MNQNKKNNRLPINPNKDIFYDKSVLKEIWFAGGCFWGVQAYFTRIFGVAQTNVGYANGKTQNPSYKEIANTGHSEAVHILYDPLRVNLETLLSHFFMIIDPISLNRQGGDSGIQYRTGIYYTNEIDKPLILEFVKEEQKKYKEAIVTEILKLNNFYPAEEYHQDYLEKNPNGYCHISFSTLNKGEGKKYEFDAKNIKVRL